MLKTQRSEAHTELERDLIDKLIRLSNKWRENRAAREQLDREADQLIQDITALNAALHAEARLSLE
jgi:uncharacterized protein YjiS (DUF1127 family)